MRELIAHVPLRDRRTGGVVEAELYDAIEANNTADFDNLWVPMFADTLLSIQQASPGGGTLEGNNIQDAHWRWGEKMVERSQSLVWRSFAVECQGETQGLMLVKLSHLARAPGQVGRDAVYVDLLSSAPWNRARTTQEPRFQGVGRILLATAVSLSIDEELEGRVGLHSLPQSEEWYRERCRMTELDPDPQYQNLRYFEMTPEQAKAFLA